MRLKPCLLFLAIFSILLTNVYADSSINDDGTLDAPVFKTSSVKSMPAGQLSGYNVLVVVDNNMYHVDARIRALGANVTVVTPAVLDAGMLSGYDVVWIGVSNSAAIRDLGKQSIILDYVQSGGGLIVEQPNEVMTLDFVPYLFTIVDKSLPVGTACARTIVDTDHFLTQGLPETVMPPVYDVVGPVGPEWDILVVGSASNPTLAVAEYSNGRIIIQTGLTADVSCICGVCQEDVLLERMIKWAAEDNTIPAPEVPVGVLLALGSAVFAGFGFALKKRA